MMARTSNRVRPHARGTLKVTVDELTFCDGTVRPIQRLEPSEWEGVPDGPPGAFVQALVKTFLAKNGGIGLDTLLKLLVSHAAHDLARAAKHCTRRRYRPIGDFTDRATLAGLRNGTRVVPRHLVTVLADALGVPDEIILRRGSSAARPGVDEGAETSAAHPSVPPAAPVLERLRPLFAALPLSRPLADAEMLAIARRIAVALAS